MQPEEWQKARPFREFQMPALPPQKCVILLRSCPLRGGLRLKSTEASEVYLLSSLGLQGHRGEEATDNRLCKWIVIEKHMSNVSDEMSQYWLWLQRGIWRRRRWKWKGLSPACTPSFPVTQPLAMESLLLSCSSYPRLWVGGWSCWWTQIRFLLVQLDGWARMGVGEALKQLRRNEMYSLRKQG